VDTIDYIRAEAGSGSGIQDQLKTSRIYSIKILHIKTNKKIEGKIIFSDRIRILSSGLNQTSAIVTYSKKGLKLHIKLIKLILNNK